MGCGSDVYSMNSSWLKKFLFAIEGTLLEVLLMIIVGVGFGLLTLGILYLCLI